jgi:hypothetical protein
MGCVDERTGGADGGSFRQHCRVLVGVGNSNESPGQGSAAKAQSGHAGQVVPTWTHVLPSETQQYLQTTRIDSC